MGQPFDEPPYPPLTARDFGPGKAYRVELQNGGRTVAIGDPNDKGCMTLHRQLQPTGGTVDVVIHGLPGRFIERFVGSRAIPIDLVVQLLLGAGIPKRTPLRLLTCHAAEAPLHGDAVAQTLATNWGGPVRGPNGILQVVQGKPNIHLVDWEPNPMGGMLVNIIGRDQGVWIDHQP